MTKSTKGKTKIGEKPAEKPAEKSGKPELVHVLKDSIKKLVGAPSVPESFVVSSEPGAKAVPVERKSPDRVVQNGQVFVKTSTGQWVREK